MGLFAGLKLSDGDGECERGEVVDWTIEESSASLLNRCHVELFLCGNIYNR